MVVRMVLRDTCAIGDHFDLEKQQNCNNVVLAQRENIYLEHQKWKWSNIGKGHVGSESVICKTVVQI